MSRRKKPTSGYRGVSSRGRRRQAIVGVGGKALHRGDFATKKEAALAYNEAALFHHKEFAVLNEIED